MKYRIFEAGGMLLAGLVLNLMLWYALANRPVETKANTRAEETPIEYITLEPESVEVTTIPVILEETTEPIIEAITEPEIQKISLGEFKITAYCSCSRCCGEFADGITSTGTVATEGRTIAVDPSVIPYGSIVEIAGVEYIAEDCGGAIKQNKIDIFYNLHSDALEWGVQYHEVFILSN